jgi:hypothetical protein
LFANGTSSCRQCGFTGSVINPICLGCAWTGKEAQQHEFASSKPRARRASAPSTVFLKFDFSTFLSVDHANIDSSNRPQASLKQRELKSAIDSLPIVSSQSPYMPVDQTSFEASAVGLNRDYIDDIDTNMANDYTQQREVLPVPDGLGAVATATRTVWGKNLLQNRKANPSLSFYQSPTPSLLFAQSTVEYNSEQHNSAMGLKPSRKTLNVSRTDKMPSLYPDDAHEHAKNVSRRYDNELTPTPIKSVHPHSPKHQHFHPLRRKNHLHIMPCAPNPDTSEPIAISLTLHHSSPPTSTHVSRKSSQRLSHSHTRSHSHPQSISSGDSGDPVTPVSPTYQQSPPPTSFPPPKTRNSSPVRLGHPTRPYYTAIRKNISPPTPSRSRPQSAVTPMTSTATMTNAARHLSMSAMPPSAFSAFDNDDNDNGDFEVHSGPSNSARLSLSSNHHRQSYDSRTQSHTRNAQSLSRAAHGMISNRSNGFGFSMSGETELRMALAASSSPSGDGVASTTFGRRPTSSDGFQYRETVIPTQNMNNNNKKNIQNPSTNTRTDHLHTPHADSFMGRVKKLRKGLKEMLMN